MRKLCVIAPLLFSLLGEAPGADHAPGIQDRVGIALLIGNSRYNQAELPAVRVDFQKLGKALQSLGFVIAVVEDLPRPRDFEDNIRGFLRDENARPEDILLVYDSGHGLQLEGKPQLLGTGVTATSDLTAGLRAYSEPVDRVIDIMEQAAPAARILIVDACRNNPFSGAARRAGVSYQNEVEDSYILFADEPGKTVPARSDTEFQSPFTAGLLFALETSAGGLEERFELGRAKTRELSPDQNPQLYKSTKSANRHKPFLDAGGKRAADGQSAPQLLDLARKTYEERRWSAFNHRLGRHALFQQTRNCPPDWTGKFNFPASFKPLRTRRRMPPALNGWTPRPPGRRPDNSFLREPGFMRRPRSVGCWRIIFRRLWP